MSDSLFRQATNHALSQLQLTGRVLDLGGDKHSTYLKLIKGSFEVTIFNQDPKAQPDILGDVEKPLPFKEVEFDAVLMINLLEHTYHYKELLQEVNRILKPGGQAIIVVPFLFPIHPSPNDYFRFTKQGLARICHEASLDVKTITPLGSGVWQTRHLLLNRLLPSIVKTAHGFIGGHLSKLLDNLTQRLAVKFNKKYHHHDYPLGYLVAAVKPKDLEHPLSEEAFLAYCHNCITNAIELAVLKSINNKWHILLIYRHDQFYKGWHMPGSIILPGETIDITIKRLRAEEVKQDFTRPVFVKLAENTDERGQSIGLVHACLLKGDYKGEGKMYSLDNIPADTLSYHQRLIKIIKEWLQSKDCPIK